MTRSLSLCSLSLSLSLFLLLLLLFVLTFHHPQKWAVRYKNKNSLPSPLSRVDKSIRSSSAQIVIDCNQRTPRVLHKIFPVLSSLPRVVSPSSTREREREREREKKKEKKKKFCSTKYAKRGKKNKVSLLLLFCRHSRETGSDTRIITQFFHKSG